MSAAKDAVTLREAGLGVDIPVRQGAHERLAINPGHAFSETQHSVAWSAPEGHKDREHYVRNLTAALPAALQGDVDAADRVVAYAEMIRKTCDE